MSTNNPMTQEELDAIQERVNAATPGPWAVDSDDPAYIIYPEKGGWDGLVIAQVADQDGALFSVEHNGSLIANAPQDLADLLAEVERLRALTTVDDDMVKRAARAMCDIEAQPDQVMWDKLDEDERDSWRIDARAALEAALNSGEGS